MITFYNWLTALISESQVCDCCAWGIFCGKGQYNGPTPLLCSDQWKQARVQRFRWRALPKSSHSKLLTEVLREDCSYQPTSNLAPVPRECWELQSFVRRRDGSPRLQLVHCPFLPPPTLIFVQGVFHWSPKSVLCLGV